MSFKDLFPETLYETYCFTGSRICLVCGWAKAKSILRSTEREVVPLCNECSIDWNFYGYGILKKIKPKKLMRSVFLYKLLHLFTTQSVLSLYRELKKFGEWSVKMKKFSKRMENNG